MKNANYVKQSLETCVINFLYKEGYTLESIFSLNLASVKFERLTNHVVAFKVIVSELNSQTMFELSKKLTEVAKTFDPSAHFEMSRLDVLYAEIDLDPSRLSEFTEVTPKHLSNLGEALCIKLSDDLNEDFWVDEISYNMEDQILIIKVSSASFESTIAEKVDLMSITDVIKRDDLISKLMIVISRNMLEM